VFETYIMVSNRTDPFEISEVQFNFLLKYETEFLLNDDGTIKTNVQIYFEAIINGTEISHEMITNFKNEVKELSNDINEVYQFDDNEFKNYDGSTDFLII